jgi:hypothetical protein
MTRETPKMTDSRFVIAAIVLVTAICTCYGEVISVTYDRNTLEYKIHKYEVIGWVALAEYKNLVRDSSVV